MSQDLNTALRERLSDMTGREMPPPAPEMEPPQSDGDDIPLEAEVEQLDDEAVAEEAETDEYDEQAAEADGEADEETGEQPETGLKFKVAELAEQIGWEATDLYNDLVVPLVDGTSLTLGEMKDQYDQVAERRAEVEQAQAGLQQQYQQLQQYQQQLMSGAQAQTQEIAQAQGELIAIEQQYGSVDWDKLEQDDPGRAANLRQRFATAYAGAKQKLQETQQQHQQQAEQWHRQEIQRHNQALLEMVPEWKNQETWQKESQEIANYLLQSGFTAEELPQIYHAGARKVARDAWLWNQHKAQVGKAQEKVRKAPKKLMRPGQPKANTKAQDARVDQLKARAKQTGTQGDKIAAARAIVQSAASKRNRRQR